MIMNALSRAVARVHEFFFPTATRMSLLGSDDRKSPSAKVKAHAEDFLYDVDAVFDRGNSLFAAVAPPDVRRTSHMQIAR